MDSLTTAQLECGRLTGAKVDGGGCHGRENKDAQLKYTRDEEDGDLFTALPGLPLPREAQRYCLLHYYI